MCANESVSVGFEVRGAGTATTDNYSQWLQLEPPLCDICTAQLPCQANSVWNIQSLLIGD